MTPWDALKVGLVQCLAMIPGTSRSGATIIGGMLLGLSRKAATDFSFYLAMPTLIGAASTALYKERACCRQATCRCSRWGLLSFVSAWICVRWLLRYISSHTFTPFALVPHRLRCAGARHGFGWAPARAAGEHLRSHAVAGLRPRFSNLVSGR